MWECLIRLYALTTQDSFAAIEVPLNSSALSIMASGGRPSYLQDTEHDDAVSRLNRDMFGDMRENKNS